MVPLALGSQTLGSIIRPASYCGVYGFKPSYGRISRTGVLSLSETLDTLGALGTSLTAVESFYRAVASDHRDIPLGDGEQPRLAYCEGPGWEQTSDGARMAFEREIARLQHKGIKLEQLMLPEIYAKLPNAGLTIHDYEIHRNFATDRLGHWDQLSEKFQGIMRRGAKVSVGQYESAIALAEWCRTKFNSLVGDVDAILTLSATDEAPNTLDHTGSPAVNIAWTLLRGPCISLPRLLGPTGLPIGIQLYGPQFTDNIVLACAHWLERQ